MTGSSDRLQALSTVAASDVVVLGCGNMGTAIARALLTAGRSVTVWNRTAARSQALAADGAEVQHLATDAVSAAPLIILCLGTTEDVRQLFDAVDPEQLADRTLVNLTSGTPEDARGLRDWARIVGVRYLDGAIGAYPEQIGSEEARILVAGDPALFEEHQGTILEIAGSSIHVGADHGSANAVDAAMTGAFYISSLACFVEAARYVRKFGVSHDVLSTLSAYSVTVLDHQVKRALDRMAADDFSTDQATLDVYAEAATTFAATLNSQGYAPMAQAAAQVLRQAVGAGLGDQDIAAAVNIRP